MSRIQKFKLWDQIVSCSNSICLMPTAVKPTGPKSGTVCFCSDEVGLKMTQNTVKYVFVSVITLKVESCY